MKWVTSTPTKPGFYYWQGGTLIGNQVAVVQVSKRKNEKLPMLAEELCVGGFKNAPADGPVDTWAGIWAGPLPQPYYG